MHKKFFVLAAFVAPLAFVSVPADAKGCLKGAAVGGVAGHVAGQHAVIGAAAGCAVEHHREKVRDRKAAAMPAGANSPAPMNTAPGTAPR